MKLSNEMEAKATVENFMALRAFCIMMSPVAPHFAAELWELLTSLKHLDVPQFHNRWAGDVAVPDVFQQKWPLWEEKFLQQMEKTVVIMVM
jgi:leucyl-tRNA synthetase